MEMGKAMTTLTSLLLLLMGAYGLMVALLYVSQDRMLYYPNMPSREHSGTPADIGLEYETVTLVTEDELQLNAWLIHHPKQKGVVLFCHGNAGNISHRLSSIKVFHDLGFSVLIFDYRGYGKSEGTPSESGTYKDAETAWRYLTEVRNYQAIDIILFGRSLGGSIAAYLATKQSPKAIVVESSFTSVPDLAAKLYPLFPVRWLTKFHYPTSKYLQRIRCPVLVVHSRDDEIIPFDHGRALYAAAAEPKQMLELRGSHNDAFLRDKKAYMEGLRSFLSRE